MLVSKRRSLVSKKGKNTSQTGKQFRKYFYCFCLAEALLAEAEVEKTPNILGLNLGETEREMSNKFCRCALYQRHQTRCIGDPVYGMNLAGALVDLSHCLLGYWN